MRSLRRLDGVVWAGLFVVWTVAWSVPLGRISADTKNDLYVDPWGFMARSLHAWDPQVTWGGIQNQAYGYLFPMGPFFGIGSELLPMWVVQRLWWMTLLTAGFVAMLGLLGALQIGTRRTRVIAALAYVLAPRVVSTLGALSSEAHPQLLAPAVLWPLVLVDRGVMGARRGAALSGVAILWCGGVNATATAFAVLPAAIWLLTRTAWWRRALTWWWGVAVVAATSWWLVPLLVMGRYSPPFLDWIENSSAVSARVGALDVLRGTTHWLAHVATQGGAWWPAGYQLVSSRALIVATAAVMAAGLAGLAVRSMPHRAFVLSCLVVGVLAISLPHDGPLASPLVSQAQAALDGALAPLRNVHKADLLVRLPLALGLSHLLGAVAAWRPTRAWARPAVLGSAALVVIAAATPAFSGAIVARGNVGSIPDYWRDVGAWLDTSGDGRALIVPAANFAEYTWGRPLDEPLRPLTSSPYAVRDGVPLAPAGTIRLLDEVERRLQTGRALGGATEVLRDAGVRYLLVRNDLSIDDSGQPPVAFARSAIQQSPDTRFVRGFGPSQLNLVGDRVFQLEVFELQGEVAPELALWPMASVLGSTGATEDLARLAEAGLQGPVVFDGDRVPSVRPSREVGTDGFRARTRWFGAPRGQDVSPTLSDDELDGAPDYLPWSETGRRSLVSYEGISDVTASSSIATEFGFAGLQPAHRPFAALDGDERTAWVTLGDPRPRLTLSLPESADVREVSIQPYADRVRFGDGLGTATRVRVTTDSGEVRATLAPTSPTRVALPPGRATSLVVEILDTTRGAPGDSATGLAEVRIPGVTPVEVVSTPATDEQATALVLGAGLSGKDGCAAPTRETARVTCFAGQLVDPESTGDLVRDVSAMVVGPATAAGTLAIDPLRPPERLLDVPGVTVGASSLRGYAPASLPVAVVDGNPLTAWSPSGDDESPSLTLELETATTFADIRLQTRREWAEKESPAVLVAVDGVEVTTRRLQPGGVLSIPPTTGRTLTLTFTHIPGPRKPGLGALELEELELVGQPFAPAPPRLEAPCGEGPRLTVDGVSVPTSATASRDALFGLSDITWRACGSVEVSASPRHRVVLEPWQGMGARSVVLTHESSRTDASSPVAVEIRRLGATEIRGRVDEGAERLLVMTENANPGWEATLAGRSLEPQTLDARRQGFVVPAGAAGELVIRFAPDGPYRTGLLAGALAALLLLGSALAPDRSGARVSRRASALGRPAIVALGLAGAGLLVAGPTGAAIALLAVVLVRRLAAPRWFWPAGVLALGVAAAVTQAVLAPGAPGASAVEGSVRVLVLAAITLAVAASSQEPPRQPR
ncbi:alpha-(1-_3)-arabinofuranosyltransferase domain-containing protein [Knoellia sp. CPCC 206435]|uniref:alpha-(1->3)-arabinofuranosyltransferase domain-containing protein n=1 Tax=Knoellia terrae TaxID=3404797 RepID=UPI003B43D3F1